MLNIISTVAYGDFYPQSDHERLLLIVLQTLSFIVVPVTFGLLAGVLLTIKKDSEAE
jgi:Ion channel